MGLFITFYAADPEAFITLHKHMASAQTIKEASFMQKQLAHYPHVDFLQNLAIPDHTDALCQAIIEEGLVLHSSSLDLFGAPLWENEMANIHQLPHTFVQALTQAGDISLLHIAKRWVNSFLPNREDATNLAIVEQQALNALSDLRTVASFALQHHQSLLLSFSW